MKLVLYVSKNNGEEAERLEFLLTDAECAEASGLWAKDDIYFCSRLDAYLPKPNRPITTPTRYARFSIFGDPKTSLEYAKADDGIFYEIAFSDPPRPLKSKPASQEVIARLYPIEEYPKITPDTSFTV